jgi:polar amino acid transport system permease protein
MLIGPGSAADKEFPYWLAASVAISVGVALTIISSTLYTQIFTTVISGIGITIVVTLIAFTLALLLGLSVALLLLSGSIWLRQTARFYVEIIRGIPMLVLLFWIAFVGVPLMVAAWNWLLTPLRDAGKVEELLVRDVPLLWRTIAALTIGYSAFIAEVFRAGIQSVPAGQIEAAQALGLTRFQRFRFIVFPQAVRTIMPALGNDFIAMVKDSSLVSVLGVNDIMQMAKLYIASTFRGLETYSMAAYIYLHLTIANQDNDSGGMTDGRGRYNGQGQRSSRIRLLRRLAGGTGASLSGMGCHL